jgi:predicted transposase YdaD
MTLEKSILDTKSHLLQAKREGEARGIQIGETRGEKRGVQIGEKRGIQIGEARAAQALAQKLLTDGFTAEQVVRYTQLDMQTVLVLQAGL